VLPVPPLPDLSKARVTLSGRDVLQVNLTVTATADGAFKFDGLMPATFRVTAMVPPPPGSATSPWSVRSAMLGDRDVADSAIDVGADLSNLVVTFDRRADAGRRHVDRWGR
jgi:hypothetical protein